MTKLEQLIKELCPNGVEYVRLGDICTITKGKTPIQKAVPGEYPLVVTTSERKSCNTYQFDNSAVCIPLVSSRGHGVASLNHVYFQSGKFALGNILCAVIPNDESILSANFLYHYLEFKKDTLLVPLMKGGANVSLHIDDIQRVKIPLPPLEVQNRTIEILDKFVELSDALAKELSARQNQYKYYRDRLLDFGGSRQTDAVHGGGTSECEWRTVTLLDMLCQPITDGPHTTPTFVDKGIPFVSVDSVWDGRIHFENMRGYITEEFDLECCKKYKPQKHDIYMVKSGSTTGKVAYVDTDERFNIWSPLAAMRVNENNSSRYLYHLLQTKRIQEMVKAKASHGSQPNLGMRELEKFEVTIPPLVEQLRIVEILDRFDKLCNDISEGLPAEIEARRKQYEYYRDKLLSFEERKNA